MKVNNVEITESTILATRIYFADISRACIKEAKSGEVRVNDLASYVSWRERSIEEGMNGDHDHTLTFLQAALWIQTGECIAILK